MGSSVAERRSAHSRDPSWDKKYPMTPNGNVAHNSHSRDSSREKKYDDLLPLRRTPPSISILPTSNPGTRRNSNDYSASTMIHSASNPITWAAEKMGITTHNSRRVLKNGLKKLSTSLPPSPSFDKYYSLPNEKAMLNGQYPYHISFRSSPISYIKYQTRRTSHFLSKPKRLFTLIALILLLTYMFRASLFSFFKSSRFLGGGSKFVIILASNQGGGVLNWKGAKEWAVERESIRNKKAYAARHGYTLEIRDMKSMKRYAHEWRESWEKVDVIRQTMRKYPHAEWFWYLDLQTYIMEPDLSLQQHIFNHIEKVTYRDINKYNPINISHPPAANFLDEVAKSKEGDGDGQSVSMIVPQDCGGFNLGSFFIRRGEFADRLMDIWWDPVGYEQLHMVWEHKEQDVLEHIYTHQPWTRNGIAFIPQRMINSFPPGACNDKAGDEQIFYRPEDRDFVVNMAGCEWGRDCSDEMKRYKEISEKLNRRRGWFW